MVQSRPIRRRRSIIACEDEIGDTTHPNPLQEEHHSRMIKTAHQTDSRKNAIADADEIGDTNLSNPMYEATVRRMPQQVEMNSMIPSNPERCRTDDIADGRRSQCHKLRFPVDSNEGFQSITMRVFLDDNEGFLSITMRVSRR